MKFKAAILVECGRPLEIDLISLKNQLSEGQVLVKLYFSGVCGKQVEEYTGKMGPDKFLPHLLGHEGFGEVVDKHKSVRKLKTGDKVVMHWMKGVGYNSDTPEYDWNGMSVNAGWITTFNEYAVISENRLTQVENTFEGDIACLLGCAVTTGIGAVINESSTRPYDKVAVIGCGGVGLNCISGAKIINSQRVDAFDLVGDKRQIACEYGADNFYVIGDEPNVEYTKVFVTAPQASAIEFATKICSINADVYVLGIPGPDEFASISALKLHRNTAIHGASGGGIIPERDIPLYYSFYTRDLIKMRDQISKIISLNDINDTIQGMLNGTVNGRHVIKFI